MTIAEKIRLTRQQKDLSQGDLAKTSGINIKRFPATNWGQAFRLRMRSKPLPMHSGLLQITL